MSLDLFHHLHIDNQAPKTIFLLHGTGADEHDLLGLVEPLGQQFNIVSLRGNVTRFGMRRFFALKEPGSFAPDNFDLESIAQETAKLAQFVQTWYKSHQTGSDNSIFLGYSNGANMILATLFNYPEIISQAMLLHCLLPLPAPTIDLSDKDFLVTYGENDQMIIPEETSKVITALKDCGARVTDYSHPGGHEISQGELTNILKFLG